jgi:hypothetical protein
MDEDRIDQIAGMAGTVCGVIFALCLWFFVLLPLIKRWRNRPPQP